MPARSGHSRAKNVDYDADEDDVYFDSAGDEDGDGTTAEDREQLKLGTIRVREMLGTHAATDAQIQESLWHYYYDVDKTVSYLKNQSTPKQAPHSNLKQPKAASRFEQAAGAAAASISTGKHHGMQSSGHASALSFPTCNLSIDAPFESACREASSQPNDFFWDTPWGSVPQYRLGRLRAQQPQWRGGLLGGSSKLAQLAAKRRQTPSAQANGAKDTDAAVALLDKLQVGDATKQGEAKHARTIARYPRRRSPPPAAQMQEEVLVPEAVEPVVQFSDLRATPSLFASTLFGQQETREDKIAPIIPLKSKSSAMDNAFADPSPDDIVRRAQTHGTPKKKTAAKRAADQKLTQSVEKLAVDTPKVKSKSLNVVEEFASSNMKRTTSFVVIGHVDHGKSTLMGRLLFDLEVVDQRTLDKLRREAETIGKSSFALAWVMDQTSEERSRGVTVDIATEHFQTARTRFTILDAPGHRDFVPRMIAGASQADFAVLVIDAGANSFESGLKGQTKEHTLVVRSMGIKTVVVAVNKMDSVSWSKSRFDAVSREMTAFFTSAGFLQKDVVFVPCAGLTGDNVTKRVKDPEADWYAGGTLIDALDAVEPAERNLKKALRMTVGDVFRGGITNPVSISGRIDTGTLQVGDMVVIEPAHETATIKGIELESEPLDWAVAGQIPTLHLADIDPVHIRLGDVVCDTRAPVKLTKSFTAKILAFEHVLPGSVDVFRSQLWAEGKVTRLSAVLDKFSGAVVKKKVRIVKPGEVARIVVELASEMPLEVGTRVVLREGGRTLAAGLLEG